MKLINDNLFANPLRQADFFDHFFGLDTTNIWTDTSADASAAPSLLVAGESSVVLDPASTDNFECLLSTKTKWDILASRPLLMEVRAQYTEANTDDANIFIGFSSIGATADLLRDDGLGISTTSASGMWFYKVDGGTKWKVGCQVGTTSYGDNTTHITAGGASYATFRIEVRPISSTEAEIVYSIDANGGTNFVVCRDNSTGAPIKHIITYTSFAPAFLALDVKNGGSNKETLNIDYVRVSQVL